MVREHGQKLYNLCYRLSGDLIWAEDLLQESLLEAHKSYPRFKGDSSLYTWVYRVTVNTCLKHLDKKNTREKAAKALKDEALRAEPAARKVAAPSEEEVMLQKALLSEIREKCHHFMIFNLTKEQRVTLLLRDLFEFSYKEVAAILDVSEDVVRSRLRRARQSLKKRFEERCSWLNPENPCRCENRIPYVLGQYPQLLGILKKRLNREDYNQEIEEQLSKVIHSESDILATFPLIEIKLEPFLKKLS